MSTYTLLRREKLENYVDTELASLVVDDGQDESKPTAGFQRVIQRAVMSTSSHRDVKK